MKKLKYGIDILLYKMGITPTVLYEGVRFYYQPQTDMGKKLYWIPGGNERSEINTLKKLLKSDDVVIDVGANVGGHTVSFAKSIPNGSVHSFEPAKSVFKILKKNIKRFPNTHIYPYVVGSKEELISFYESVDSGYSSTGTSAKPITSTYQVQSVTIDSLNLPRVDLIKIDVEGGETEVIKGAARTINKNKPVIFCEIRHDGTTSPEERIGYIKSFGYDVYTIEKEGLQKFTAYDIFHYNLLFLPQLKK